MIENLVNFPSIALLGLYLRWSVSLHPYSGANKPPMYGDYEAQRHWQEITVNLPIHQWYVNGTDNDLLYWGLDYPPLTAYHSYICGILARFLNNDYVTLYKSRGFESYNHKLFMRSTVLFADIFIYIPLVYFLCRYTFQKRTNSLATFFALMLYPGLILIDYGHFQYNNVSSGLFLFAVASMVKNWYIYGAIAFSLALNYKQMKLYHALPFFFFLLGKCKNEKSFRDFLFLLSKISVAVILTFVICWLPFLQNIDQIKAVFIRIFPIGRGLYEDKVANIWCSLSIFFKFKMILNENTMAFVCLIVTALFVLPSCIHLFFNPSISTFKYSLINCSLIFFLVSFHVHEKSILLVVIPACLFYCEHRTIVTWLSFISLISMVPLLLKDGLIVPTVSLAALTFLSHFLPLKCEEKSIMKRIYLEVMFKLSVALMSFTVLLGLILSPPFKYPDLFPVILSILSCGHFCFFLLYFHICQFLYNRKTFKTI